MQGLMQPVPLTLVHAFERAESLFADKGIVTGTPQGRDRTTYGAWADRARRVGGVLDALGVSADGRVGTFAWNTARHLELYFGVPCTGRVLHTLNIRLFPEQLRFVVAHAADEVVFVERSVLGLFWPLIDDLPSVRAVVVIDDGAGPEIPDDPRIRDYETLLAEARPVDFAVADENRAAAMCYTSGTTGNPRGVVYSHRSIVLHALGVMLADTLALCERDVCMPVVPMFHANAWGLAHAAPMSGSTLVLPGPDLSPGALAALMEEEGVTLAAGVPTIWRGVLPELEGRDLGHLKRIVCGGSAVPRALSEAYRAQLGRPILQAWGMTEMSPVGSVARIKSTLADRPEEELADFRASIGLPTPLVELRVIDGETGERVAPDGHSQGELQARGPWVAAAYYDDEESNRAQFTADGWLRTGDVATVDANGYHRLVDRTKDVIKSGGEWISSVDLENTIMADARVAEAAVIAVPDERWGERPLACVVPAPGQTLEPDDVRSFLDGRVAKWWIPERVEIIDEVPKTSVGKFSKKDLRARFAGQPAERA